MTTEQLIDHFWFNPQKVGYGHWKYGVRYRGRIVMHTTTNSMAIDRLSGGKIDMYGSTELRDSEKRYGYTYKQALQTLYNEAIKNY